MSEADLTALRDDIAYLKTLSSDALARPAPGLWLMVVFGGGFGASGLIAYGMGLAALISRDMTLTRFAAWPFYISALAFVVALAVVGWRMLRQRREGAAMMSRPARAAWTAAFLGLVTVIVSFKIFAFAERHQAYSPGYAEHLAPAFLLALWGAAWWVAGYTGERVWARLIGPASFLAALAAALSANTFHILLIGGLSLLLLMAAPAAVLLREIARR